MYAISRKTDDPNLRKSQKKSNFGPDFCPILSLNVFFFILLLLDVVYCCKLPLYAILRKTNKPNLRKFLKPRFGPDFGPFGQNSGPKKISIRRFYIYQMLDIIASYQYMQFQGKLMNQTWENGKKLSFGTILARLAPNLVPEALVNITLLI